MFFKRPKGRIQVKKPAFFRRCFFLFWLLCIVLMGVRLVTLSHEDAQRRTEQLLQSGLQSAAHTRQMSVAARQTAATFHTEATVALLDETGTVVAQTQEFLLLRDTVPRLALLSDLTVEERTWLRTTAAAALSEVDLSRAAAFVVEYPYGDVVNTTVESGRAASMPVTTPVSLQLEPTAAADVWQAKLSTDGSAYELWLPYLRDGEAENMERLCELARGAQPQTSLFRWEHFQLQPAPEGLGAASLAAYQLSHPLWDTLRGEGWMLLVYPLLATFCSAALALAAERIWRGLQSKERA